ncbi:phage tail protein [Denitromonas halophila]|uniref:Phage tail protein n=1 Tax=Denitromonas halophila TaxID=1629404 RepID=A0A557QJW7_9RHOO|nr:phage tail protein [Denitromonas halophila]TVO53157.1 phage tail protein [Denitromonas halophila]
MNTFTWVPSYGSALTVKPNVNATQFGDGYEVRVAIGINSQPRKWQLTLTNKPLAVADAIEAFLKAHGALTAFYWTPPHGELGKWVCREWSVQPTSPRHRSITGTFEEVFEN